MNIEKDSEWNLLNSIEEQQEPSEPEKPALQLRKEGRPYCPECYTFGYSHRLDCSHKNDGMSSHVRNEELK